MEVCVRADDFRCCLMAGGGMGVGRGYVEGGGKQSQGFVQVRIRCKVDGAWSLTLTLTRVGGSVGHTLPKVLRFAYLEVHTSMCRISFARPGPKGYR